MRFNSGFSNDSKFEYIKKLVMKVYYADTSVNEDYNNHLHLWFSDDENEVKDVFTDLDENGEYVMIIGVGLIEDIYSYAYTAFSDKEVINQLGKSAEELNITIQALYRDGDIQLSDAPLDKKRREAADKTAEYMLLFIIAHEMAHLTNGHNAYLKATYGRGLAKMQEDGDLKGTYGDDRKILEYDADMSSATRMACYMMDECKLFVPFARDEDDVEDVIFIIGGFAIYGVFALCSSFSSNHKFYLSFEERFLLTLACIGDLIDQYMYFADFGTGYRYALLKNDMVLGSDFAAEYSKKEINPNLKKYNEIVDSNKKLNEHLQVVNKEWNRLLSDPDLKEAAVFNLYDSEAEKEWKKEMGIPERIAPDERYDPISKRVVELLENHAK